MAVSGTARKEKMRGNSKRRGECLKNGENAEREAALDLSSTTAAFCFWSSANATRTSHRRFWGWPCGGAPGTGRSVGSSGLFWSKASWTKASIAARPAGPAVLNRVEGSARGHPKRGVSEGSVPYFLTNLFFIPSSPFMVAILKKNVRKYGTDPFAEETRKMRGSIGGGRIPGQKRADAQLAVFDHG